MIALAFDLVRHEALMTLKPVPHDAIIEIVDEIFLLSTEVLIQTKPVLTFSGKWHPHRQRSKLVSWHTSLQSETT